QFSEQLSVRALGLLSEAQMVGIFPRGPSPDTTDVALERLREVTKWKPAAIPDEDTRRIAELEDEISRLRKDRAMANETLRATRLYADKENGFASEAEEQKSRLESIHALPRN